MTLNGITDKIRVVLLANVTTNQLQCTLFYTNSSMPAIPSSRTLINTNNTSHVVLLSGEQGTTSIKCTSMNIYNSDTANATVIVSYYNGTTDFILKKQVLKPGEVLQYNESEGFFLNNSITSYISDIETNRYGIVDRFGGIYVSQLTHLVGGEFSSTLDTQKWRTTLVNAGTVAVTGGEALVSTNTTANGSAILYTFRAGRFLSSNSSRFLGGVRLNNTGVANNIRKWGLTDISGDNKIYWQLNGTTPGITTINSAVSTTITTFNGSNPFVLDTNQHTYEIHISGGRQEFFQDGKLIHTIIASTASSIGNWCLRLFYESTNSGGITSNNQLILRGQALSRFGQQGSRHDFYYTTSAEVKTLKLGCGTLKRILVTQTGGGTITIWNNTTNSGEIIALIDQSTRQNYEFDVDFDSGLTFETAGATGDISFIWD